MRSELFFVRFLLGVLIVLVIGLYVPAYPDDLAAICVLEFVAGAFTGSNLAGYVLSEIREARRR
mgnify:CR=1 FL=1